MGELRLPAYPAFKLLSHLPPPPFPPTFLGPNEAPKAVIPLQNYVSLHSIGLRSIYTKVPIILHLHDWLKKGGGRERIEGN